MCSTLSDTGSARGNYLKVIKNMGDTISVFYAPLVAWSDLRSAVLKLNVYIYQQNGDNSHFTVKEKSQGDPSRKAKILFDSTKEMVIQAGITPSQWKHDKGNRLLAIAVYRAYCCAVVSRVQGVISFECDFRRPAGDRLAVTFASSEVVESAHG